MDKNAIKKYAVWARRELIERVSQRALVYGITAKEVGDPNAESVNGHLLSQTEKRQRQALIRNIKEKGYEQVMEEVAYTWFNRFAALRFMEINSYLPSHIRVFTNDAGEFKPQILAEAIHLDLDGLDMNKVYELEGANKSEELFKYLLIVQCNALNSILPGMFQRIEDYTELLLPDYLLREGSVIEQMVTTIPEADWTDQVQIIGWLYQYYNIEPKDKVFADLKKNIKITKENIPAATQLFTPDWIVHYMVENSLGRLWVEGHPNEELKAGWKYYLEEAEQEPEVETQLAQLRREYAAMTPEEIRCIDPCAGSGHILAYLFDVLVQIYESYGYTAREAVRSIVERNLYGLDIDDRAAQLAYFAVMMKARQYDRRFLTRRDADGKPDVPQPHVYAIVESNHLDKHALDYFVNGDAGLKAAMDAIVRQLYDAKEYGSILQMPLVDFAGLYARFDQVRDDISINRETALQELLPLVQVAQMLAQQYDVVVTNPPYMGSSGMSAKLGDFVKKNYPDSKSDLFAVFIERCGQMTAKNRFQSMITQQSWMSLPSFLELRHKLRQYACFVSFAQMGPNGFDEISGEVVASVAFSLQKNYIKNYVGTYFDLQSGNSELEKERLYLSGTYKYFTKQDTFALVPNEVFAYDASEKAIEQFAQMKPLKETVVAKPGMQTSDNDRFLRFWHEVRKCKIGYNLTHDEAAKSEYKWFPYNKGIGFRKWYGNNDYVVNFYRDGEELKYWLIHNPKDPGTKHWSRNMRNYDFYFREGITFTAIGNSFSARLNGPGYLFDTKGPTMFGSHLVCACGFVNSKVFDFYNRMLCKQLTKTGDSVNLVPFTCEIEETKIEEIVLCTKMLSKQDWDSFETSWDFQRHPLVCGLPTVAEAYARWEGECSDRFTRLKANEEELNRIFIDIYGLQEELTPEVADRDVTVRKADLGRDIRSLISYAVGCMFGRYSLDTLGLAYAGGAWDEVYRKDHLVGEHGETVTFGGISLGISKDYTYIKTGGEWKELTFPVDADNIIPICNDDYFDGDITGRFVKWVEIVYGSDTLEENLKFIANALGGKGTSREIIRNYFLNDFYADHLKIYQKRPIYWLFDSGKKNGFKALIYLHRYQPDTIARMRTDYVHEQQSRYRTAIADLEQRIAAASTAERVKLSKHLKTIQDQAAEIQTYEEKIHHLADQYIAIDLDDGVKKNYGIFQDVLAKIK